MPFATTQNRLKNPRLKNKMYNKLSFPYPKFDGNVKYFNNLASAKTYYLVDSSTTY